MVRKDLPYCHDPRWASQWLSYKDSACSAELQETQVQSLGREDPLEEGMAVHSSVLAWRIPMDRGAWQAMVHRVAKSWTQLKWLSTLAHMLCLTIDYGRTWLDEELRGMEGISLWIGWQVPGFGFDLILGATEDFKRKWHNKNSGLGSFVWWLRTGISRNTVLKLWNVGSLVQGIIH